MTGRQTDGKIVRHYVDRYPWIELVTLARRHEHNFAGKVGAFSEGYKRVKNLDFEVVGNLDGDVSFDPGYLQFLLDKFAEDPGLGVAGTPYRETPPIRYERFKSPHDVRRMSALQAPVLRGDWRILARSFRGRGLHRRA